ncbi:YceI family protein [Jejuia pallidilutea]|jgi:polyisoprenoid-binding protein YceI|uniref:Rhodanese-like domain protein n=1 Tax=Jejuia pallidilutea TaxID=504487 RepID=A0A090VVT5_9FLAO|nr:YceI family protein [Jejuia pallidilutea]GAL67379.1 rhodanese-like domain protein [Jejuia pallidilutea]GAL90095.1 rhodanese-like domain protein [Jejuia pallidilutea]
MKLNLKTILFTGVLAIALVGCKDKAKEAETSNAEAAAEAQATAVKYIADANASIIEWKGFKPTGTHNGDIKLESGVINVNGDAIESGSFLVDMGSIQVLDIPAEDEGNGKLLGHLKSPDFFDVENHANAAFEVTGISEVEGKTMLSGNLAIKGIKQNVTFPVNVTMDGDTMMLTSEAFTIDRTKWDIKYKSKSIFGDLGDKFINDEIELKVNVTAKKA